MNIGIDIDNVISKFNEGLLNAFLNEDKKLRNNGIINKKADYITRGMFDWTEEEVNNFYHDNIQEIVENLEVKKEAKKYIDKLKKDGCNIYIITGRNNGEYKDPYSMTIGWLNKYDIYYDKLILTNAYDDYEKAKVCLENNIDIMIDDSIRICKGCIENNIITLLMDTPYNKKTDILRIHNWKEVYDYIKNHKKEKINVILDTDTYNECDDQFALSYMLKSQDIFNIEAITVAPFSHIKKGVTARDSQELSYNEIIKICNWLNFNTSNKVFKGSTDYIENGYEKDNDAVNKIIEIALKNKKTSIMAIGAITNVALAIKKEPKIINKIEVIWLGGNELGYKDNLEYNLKQDVDAVKIVFDSKVKLTILPCKNVVSGLKIDIKTLRDNLDDKSDLCNYLIDKFYDDGYHEIKESRVIWDIAVIAYMINKNWFKIKEISCPNIKNDNSYELTNNKHKIKMAYSLEADKIYKDLFNKLGVKNENQVS